MDATFLRELVDAGIEAVVLIALAAVCATAIRLALETGRGLAFRWGWPASLAIAVGASFLLTEIWSILSQGERYAGATLGICTATAVTAMVVQVRGRRG